MYVLGVMHKLTYHTEVECETSKSIFLLLIDTFFDLLVHDLFLHQAFDLAQLESLLVGLLPSISVSSAAARLPFPLSSEFDPKKIFKPSKVFNLKFLCKLFLQSSSLFQVISCHDNVINIHN